MHFSPNSSREPDLFFPKKNMLGTWTIGVTIWPSKNPRYTQLGICSLNDPVMQGERRSAPFIGSGKLFIFYRSVGGLFSDSHLVGGWTNPFEKYARQIGSFPQGSEELKIENILNHHLVMIVAWPRHLHHQDHRTTWYHHFEVPK